MTVVYLKKAGEFSPADLSDEDRKNYEFETLCQKLSPPKLAEKLNDFSFSTPARFSSLELLEYFGVSYTSFNYRTNRVLSCLKGTEKAHAAQLIERFKRLHRSNRLAHLPLFTADESVALSFLITHQSTGRGKSWEVVAFPTAPFVYGTLERLLLLRMLRVEWANYLMYRFKLLPEASTFWTVNYSNGQEEFDPQESSVFNKKLFDSFDQE